MRIPIVLSSIVAFSICAPSAFADDPEDGLVLSGGVNIGGALHESADAGWLLGGELSFVYAHMAGTEVKADVPGLLAIGDVTWGGVYSDVVRDTGTKTTRITFGPEFGYNWLGVDGGLLVELGEESRTGVVVRPVLTLSVVTLYARFGWFLDDKPESHFTELGVLLKYPLPIWEKK